jgi:hypothetical protein
MRSGNCTPSARCDEAVTSIRIRSVRKQAR